MLGTPYRRPVGTGGAEVRLEPLTRTEVGELADTVLGSRANPTLRHVLFERSGGLPLVVEEDLITLTEPAHRARLLTFKGPAPVAKGDDAALLARAEVPRGLREAVTARMTGLSPAAVALAKAAAVLAVPAGRPLLAAVAGLEPDQATEALVEALAAAMLSERTAARYGFRHMLAQQAIYGAIPGPRREDLHQRALEALRAQSPSSLVQIAHHTRALGDMQAWLEQAEKAADQAAALGDQGTAAQLLRDILDQPNLDVRRRTRAALALGRIADLTIEYSASMAALRRILSDPHLPTEVRGEIRLTLGRLMIRNLDHDGGSREIERSVRELEDARPELAARGLVARAGYEGSCAKAQQWMDRAEAAVSNSPDQVARAAVRANRLTLMARHADPAVWELLRGLPRNTNEPAVLRQSARAIVNGGISAVNNGHDERAVDLLEEGMELAGQVGASSTEFYGRNCLLILDWRAGRWEGLDERAATLAAESPEMGTVVQCAEQIHGSLAIARGQWSRAMEHLRRAADMLHDGGYVGYDALRATTDIARVHLALDHPQAAYAAVIPLVERLRRSGGWQRADDALAVVVQAALMTGHEAGTRQLLTEAARGLADLDAPAANADLHMALGILHLHDHEPDRAAAGFDRARIMFGAIGRPYQHARAIEHTAAAHRHDNPLLAADGLNRAIEVFTRLGAIADAARCQRTQRELGLARHKPRGRRGYGTGLSPREIEVARLLADSATNQDIAHALALSPRTVERHVTSVLNKLRTTRTQLQKTGYDEHGEKRDG